MRVQILDKAQRNFVEGYGFYESQVEVYTPAFNRDIGNW